MQRMLLVLVAACGGSSKGALYASSPPPPSVLDAHARLTEPITNAEVSESRRTNALSKDVAVRHRRLSPSWSDIVVTSAGGLFSAPSVPAGPPPAQVIESAGPKEPEKLVIEAWLEIQADDVAQA
ncbi:MAG TPA: hypothetical protein VLB44_08935, partial [Kofleriaceae bacterium]|nr:hypothetical protein [Kofleriaceae bacterium]